MKFTVLDDLTLWQRSLLLLLCAGCCCWGFANNIILAIFAGKIGFPFAVAVCAMSSRRQQILSVLFYTALLVTAGYCYFLVNPAVAITTELTKNFVPTATDLTLAVGVGWALSHFWNHTIRINIIILSAGLTSLGPACIMAGYWLSHNDFANAAASMMLYAQYVIGLWAGVLVDNYIGEFNLEQGQK